MATPGLRRLRGDQAAASTAHLGVPIAQQLGAAASILAKDVG